MNKNIKDTNRADMAISSFIYIYIMSIRRTCTPCIHVEEKNQKKQIDIAHTQEGIGHGHQPVGEEEHHGEMMKTMHA
jgi:hypothetical protein